MMVLRIKTEEEEGRKEKGNLLINHHSRVPKWFDTAHRLYEAEGLSLNICALRLRPSTGKSTKFCFFLAEMAYSNRFK